MATYDVFEAIAAETPIANEKRTGALAALWQRLQKRFEDRRTLRKLYHLDPHVLRDMGFEPAEIYSAYEGTFGEVHGDRFRGFDNR